MNRIAAIVFFVVAVVTNPLVTKAQFDESQDVKPKRPLKDRLFTGGGIIVNFGSTTVGYPPIPVSVMTLGASPILGYRVTDKWSVGVGGTYIYYREKAKGYPAYNTNIFGGNVFTRYTVWRSLFAHAEFGVTNWEVPEIKNNHYTGDYVRVNNYSAPVGAGLYQPISRNAAFEILALYDLMYYENDYPMGASPFTFRAGVNIGF